MITEECWDFRPGFKPAFFREHTIAEARRVLKAVRKAMGSGIQVGAVICRYDSHGMWDVDVVEAPEDYGDPRSGYLWYYSDLGCAEEQLRLFVEG